MTEINPVPSRNSHARAKHPEGEDMIIFGGSFQSEQEWSTFPTFSTQVNPDAKIWETLNEAANFFSPDKPEIWLTESFALVEGTHIQQDKAMREMLRPKFGVSLDGLAHAYPSTRDLTWNELWSAQADGIYPESVHHRLFISNDGGFGGGYIPDWLTPELIAQYAWLATILAAYAKSAGKVISQEVEDQTRELVLRIKGERASYKVRRQAKRWAEQGFGDREALAEYIFQRRFWTLDLLSTRLRLDSTSTELLLRACGWRQDEEITGCWWPSPGVTLDSCLSGWYQAEVDLGSLPAKE